jgi:hypothetical protein
MRLRRSALAVLLLGAALLQAWPLESSEGRLKLVLHRGLGRFSLYLDGVPLFVDQDPRTSWMSLLLDERVYKLGDSGEFKESSEVTAGGGRFTWTSKRLTVTQAFSFQGAEAVAVSVIIRNDSADEIAVGLRVLLDTYLGEASFPHFRTDRDREINSELTYIGTDMPAYLLSRSSRSSRAPENPGLLVLLRGEGVSTPDRLVLANWKRLSESPWLYETAAARSFSELPYSINDSAAGLYYGPASLAAGSSRTYQLVFSGGKEPPPAAAAPPVVGASAPAAAPMAAPAAAVPPAAPAPAAGTGAPLVVGAPPGTAGAAATPPAPTPTPAGLKLSIEGDLRVLDDLLQKLALKMDSKTPLTEEERGLMEQIIADLKKRLESYGE